MVYNETDTNLFETDFFSPFYLFLYALVNSVYMMPPIRRFIYAMAKISFIYYFKLLINFLSVLHWTDLPHYLFLCSSFLHTFKSLSIGYGHIFSIRCRFRNFKQWKFFYNHIVYECDLYFQDKFPEWWWIVWLINLLWMVWQIVMAWLMVWLISRSIHHHSGFR